MRRPFQGARRCNSETIVPRPAARRSPVAHGWNDEALPPDAGNSPLYAAPPIPWSPSPRRLSGRNTLDLATQPAGCRYRVVIAKRSRWAVLERRVCADSNRSGQRRLTAVRIVTQSGPPARLGTP